ncbi:LysR family transcriptional regulator [Lentilactobacillus sp. SPB1-3]|uniref:LysR family transcriptional regulator n=1 Tax=Lentilactobacillus terminaliae TaxID=3003483 RepID=A0ACD5DF40_9LACO|nr:LysR substrate-binding domain-containing protein [Lentilactobacillus sp. SPB1-3]MCZ0976276.1 LysR substrate-binding domain-containing protein [Lentilactobacillus sp. SPB1-3]
MLPFAYIVFSTVITEGTFYKASLKLNVTPSAVSHSINQLETELGFPVFNRSRTGVELTENGKTILPIIQDILNSQKRLEQEADNINGLNSGSIRIGAFSSVCINWLPPIIQEFKRNYPKIDISVYQSGFDQIVQEVKNGTLDIGFTALPISENLIVDNLIKDEIYCIAPEGFVPSNHHTVTKTDMQDRTFILQPGDYDLDTKATLDHYDIQPNSIQFSIDDQSIIAMVEAGLGWGILPELALEKISGNVAVYPFDKHFYRSIGMVTTQTQAKTPSTQRMLKIINDFINTKYPDGLLQTEND